MIQKMLVGLILKASFFWYNIALIHDLPISVIFKLYAYLNHPNLFAFKTSIIPVHFLAMSQVRHISFTK